MIKMPAVDIEKLINVVKKYPMLYDRQHENYHNFTIKTKTWKQVAKEVDDSISGEVYRIKWKGLKDSYRKYKKFKTGETPRNKSWHSWCWGENLTFLDDYEINYKYHSKRKEYQCTTPSPPRRPSSSANEEDSKEPTEPVQWTSNPQIDEEMHQTGMTSSVTDEEYDTQRILEPVQYMNETSGAGRSATDEEYEPKHSLDPVDHLFTSYCGTFRKFSLKTQCMMKVEMAKIFAEAELAEYENASHGVDEVFINHAMEPLIKIEESPVIKQEIIEEDPLGKSITP